MQKVTENNALKCVSWAGACGKDQRLRECGSAGVDLGKTDAKLIRRALPPRWRERSRVLPHELVFLRSAEPHFLAASLSSNLWSWRYPRINKRAQHSKQVYLLTGKHFATGNNSLLSSTYEQDMCEV